MAQVSGEVLKNIWPVAYQFPLTDCYKRFCWGDLQYLSIYNIFQYNKRFINVILLPLCKP